MIAPELPPEIRVLALGAILLLVHVFGAGYFKTQQYGAAWNMGPRDDTLPPLNAVAGRMVRAQANFLETLPIAMIALIGVVVTGRATATTALGGWIWLIARAVYLPLYGYGVPKVRTIVYFASLFGLGMALWPLLF